MKGHDYRSECEEFGFVKRSRFFHSSFQRSEIKRKLHKTMGHKIKLPYQSKSGATFNIHPELIGEIEKLIGHVTSLVQDNISQNKFIAYLSVPISSRGGGDFRTNTEMASHITSRMQREFGDQLWILNPAAHNLPKSAGGGDYMAVWADVLAGKDGTGGNFDMVYFAGPTDVWQFFGAVAQNRLGTISDWLDAKASKDDAYRAIADDADRRKKFIRYYGLRGSSAYSKGAHDEWNIIAEFNRNRSIGNDIAIYFDGRPIEPGDFNDVTDSGYQLLLH